MCNGNNDKTVTAMGEFILDEVHNIEHLICYIKSETKIADIKKYLESIMCSVRAIKGIAYQVSRGKL